MFNIFFKRSSYLKLALQLLVSVSSGEMTKKVLDTLRATLFCFEVEGRADEVDAVDGGRIDNPGAANLPNVVDGQTTNVHAHGLAREVVHEGARVSGSPKRDMAAWVAGLDLGTGRGGGFSGARWTSHCTRGIRPPSR